MEQQQQQVQQRYRYVPVPSVSIIEQCLEQQQQQLCCCSSSNSTKQEHDNDIIHPDDNNDEDICRQIVLQELSEEEQHIAACTSYAYWVYYYYYYYYMIVPKDNDNDDEVNNAQLSTTTTTTRTRTTTNMEQYKISMAMKEVYRHYIGQQKNTISTIQRLKATIHWRKESQVDLLRLCFSSSTTTVPLPSSSSSSCNINNTSNILLPIPISDEEYQRIQYYEQLIVYDLLYQQNMILRGYDKQYRPIIIRYPRKSIWIPSSNASSSSSTTPSSSSSSTTGTSDTIDTHQQEQEQQVSTPSSTVTTSTLNTSINMEQSYEWSQIYIAERAIAVAELLWYNPITGPSTSKQRMMNNNNNQSNGNGNNGKLCVFLDYNNYNTKHVPPIMVLGRVLSILQTHYPERLGIAIVLDAPYYMTTIMKLLSPFLSKETKDKLMILGKSSSSSWLQLPTTTVATNFLSQSWRSLSGMSAHDDNNGKEVITTNSIDTKVVESTTTTTTTQPTTDTCSNSDAYTTPHEMVIRDIVDADQAMTFMRSDGQLTFVPESSSLKDNNDNCSSSSSNMIDMKHQIYHVPFYELYDYRIDQK